VCTLNIVFKEFVSAVKDIIQQLQVILSSISLPNNLSSSNFFHFLLNHLKTITMLFQTSLVATSLLSLASARIIGIAVPETIRPGDGFNAIIQTEDYIQSVYDVAIAFGVASGAGYGPGNLGTVLDSYYLGPGESSYILSTFGDTFTDPSDL
jgi:hypothetical protein